MIARRAVVAEGVTRLFIDAEWRIYYPPYGLMHGHFDIKNLNEDTVIDSEDETSGGINTGIGVVIPVEKILETIDQPELVELRKTAAIEFRKRSGRA